MAAQDISAQLAGDISEATGGGGKPYIRHGKYYELLITRCHSKAVKMQDTKFHRFAFMEFKVLKSEPFAPGVIPVSNHSKDDGTHPNEVGTLCSNSVDWDGNGAAMAAQNVREFICGFFGVDNDSLSKEDGFRTWIDLCRREDVKVGGVDYIDPKTNQPVIATKDKIANMGCGFIIGLSTSAKELKETRQVKELPQEQRKYFTNKGWICFAKPGTGVNSKEEVAKRRAQILLEVPMTDDDEDEAPTAPPPQNPAMAAVAGGNTAQTASTNGAQNGVQASGDAPPTPPQAETAPTPPTPPQVQITPPWEGITEDNKSWMKAGWLFSNPKLGGDGRTMKVADYMAGKR